MVTATITSKGQITIPKTVRESLHLHTGDKVAFVVHGQIEVVLTPVTKTVDQVFGRLRKPGHAARTIAEMNQAIVRRMRGETVIALDTNVLVRFLVRDDERQAQAVYARFRQAEIVREVLFVPLLVVLETIWVLESAYDQTRKDILDSLDELRSMPILEFEKPQVLQGLLSDGRKGHGDLSDLLIALGAESCGCSGVLTFDRKASRLALFSLLT